MKRHVLTISLIVLGLCLVGVSASAQIVFSNADVFKVNYFANNGVAGAPDATVRIDNPGTNDADLCAMIYVFDNDQQLSECCGCPVTPNGLRTLSVGHNLTNNPLTGAVSNNGMIMVVSAAPNLAHCEPAADFGAAETVRAWASHVQNKVGSAYPITETEFSDVLPTGIEIGTDLEEQCFFVERLGSGKGVCSCGTGD